MKRKALFLILVLLTATLATTACSMNRVLPSGVDKTAMEGDVRGAISTAVPGKTFAMEVSVADGGVVTIGGHVDNQTDADSIIAAVRKVNGVTRVVNNIHVQ
jgi:osmotically-inducible protein OsmY